MMIKNLISAQALLKKNAPEGKTLTYREFAAALNIVTPPIIAACTDILEEFMLQDKLSNKPLLSSLIIQQGRAGIPRPGFYQMLKKLALYDGSTDGDDAKQWHQSEMKKLQHYYQRANLNET